MSIINDKLIGLGFKEELKYSSNIYFKNYSYNLIIENYIEYNVVITVLNNYEFEVEKKIINYLTGVNTYYYDASFKIIKNSKNSLDLLESLLNATGISEIINLNKIYRYN